MTKTSFGDNNISCYCQRAHSSTGTVYTVLYIKGLTCIGPHDEWERLCRCPGRTPCWALTLYIIFFRKTLASQVCSKMSSSPPPEVFRSLFVCVFALVFRMSTILSSFNLPVYFTAYYTVSVLLCPIVRSSHICV